MATLKIVRSLPSWPRLLLLFFLAMIIELAFSALDDVLDRRFHELLVILTLTTMFLVLPVVLSFSEQRPWRAVVESVLIASGAAATNGLLISLSNRRWESAATFGVNCAAASAVMVLFRLVALWAVRSFGHKIVLQTGSLCWTCGYDLTGNLSGVCPECGTPITQRAPAVQGQRSGTEES
ncbi:MAG: hypothetical protein AMXMBFR13_06570 [Phycisphaerae bacterium]